MAIFNDVTPSNISARVASAVAGDVLILNAGVYTTFPFKSGLTYQAVDWAVGRTVSSTIGHIGQGMSVVVRNVVFTNSISNWTVRGIFHDMRGSSSINTGVFTGNNNAFEDCVIADRHTNGTRGIGYTLGGGTTPITRFRFLRNRWYQNGQVGQNLDHPLYIKNTRASASGLQDGWLVEDCIFVNGGYFTFHLYTNADDGRALRNVVFGAGRGVTFSGAADSSTGSSTYNTSDRNYFERNIFSDKSLSGGYQVESWWQSAAGSDNVFTNNFVARGNGTSGTIKPSNPGVTLTNNVSNDTLGFSPGYANAANGDFRLSSSSPALGYGPSFIQPGSGGGGGGGTPVETAPNAVTNLQVTPGNGQNVISWTNPTSGTFDSIMVRRATGSTPSSVTAGTQIYSGTATNFTDTGLTNGTIYYYAVWAVKNGTAGPLYSVVATANGAPVAPPTEPAPGQEKFGQTVIGTNWRGMSENYKRASVFTVAANKQVTAIWARLRGTGTTTTSQQIRAFLYNDTTGALLGTSVAQNIPENLAEQWVVFTFTTPVAMPTAGGPIRIGLHSGLWSGTRAGQLEFAALTVAGALPNGVDTYADGTDATWSAPPVDNFQMSIFALTSTVSGGGGGTVVNPVTSLTATPGNAQVTLSMTNPVGAYDAIVVRRATGSYPATPTSGTSVFDGPGGSGGSGGEIVLETVVTNQDTIWSIAFDDQDRMWWTERAGRVKMLDGTTIRTVLTITGTENLSAEEGLQGLAIDPDFATNRFFYVYYSRGSSSTSITNRLSRFTFNPATNTAGSELILIDNIPGFQFHVGGRIKFGPDGYLYVAVGDGANNGSSVAVTTQDDNDLRGKVLRVNKTNGSAAPGNPISGNRMWAKGFRNVQGIAWHSNGDMYTLEHGPTGGSPDANDEVNRVVAGGNYGWPKYYGNNLLNPGSWAQALSYTTANVTAPVLSSGSTTWAPCGCTFYTGTKLGPDWTNKLIFTGLGFNTGEGKSLYRLPLTGPQLRTAGALERLYQNQYGRIRDVVEGPDEFLYFSTSNRDGRGDGSADRIIRIRRDVVDAQTTVIDTGLTNGTLYYYSVWARTGSSHSPVAQVTATPVAPGGAVDPAPGQEKFGRIALGTTWRGMGADGKRASAFSMPAGKRIRQIWVRMRGTGTTTTVVQPTRAFAYDDSGNLLGVSEVRNLNENMTEQWVVFNFPTPAPGPTAGGNVRLGLHTGAYTGGTKTGDVQFSAAIVADKLLFASDVFADGTSATYGTPTLDQFEMAIFAIIENIPAGAQPPVAATSVTPTVNANGTVNLSVVLPADANRNTLRILRRYVVPTDNTLTSGTPTEIYNQNIGTTSQTVNITDSPAKSGTYWYDAYTIGTGGTTRRSATIYPVQVIRGPISTTIGVAGTTVTGSVEVPSDSPETPVAGTTLGRKSLKIYRKSSPWTSDSITGSTLIQTFEGT